MEEVDDERGTEHVAPEGHAGGVRPHDGRQYVVAPLGHELEQHLAGQVEADHLDARARDRQGDAAGPDAGLEHRAPTRELAAQPRDHSLHRLRRERAGAVVEPGGAVEDDAFAQPVSYWRRGGR